VLPALRHRVILSPEAEVAGETTDRALEALLKTIEVPRL
jgi:MoxR-like ATPase